MNSFVHSHCDKVSFQTRYLEAVPQCLYDFDGKLSHSISDKMFLCKLQVKTCSSNILKHTRFGKLENVRMKVEEK